MFDNVIAEKSNKRLLKMALDFVKNQISCFKLASVVVDIFDRYDIQNSIKKTERDRRSKSVFTAFDCVPVDVQDLPYWFCALCHRRETILLESDQLEKTEPFQQ
jgi:hypothetical protein